MIDPTWQVSDLDPVTWRNIGHYFDPQQYIRAAQPGEHGLFVLHDDGHVLKAVDTAGPDRPAGIPDHITDPEALARELYSSGQWQRVHIINRRHLARVAREAQATPRRDYTLDAYYHLVYTLVWGDPKGYACEPPHAGQWNGWTYSAIRRFVSGLPSPATLALGVYAGEALSIGLIVLCEGGRFRRVTTFDGLAWQTPPILGPTPQVLSALRAALSDQFAPPAAILLCTDATFSGWLAATDKLSYLEEARVHATAIWYQSDVP